MRTVFDYHDYFTVELTQFFAQLNEWQNRYDLTPDEVQVFASVLVDYVSEQLTEIERVAGPIGRALERLLPLLEDLLPALRSGLAARVEEAGLSDSMTIRRLKGTEPEDWRHLAIWFVAAPRRPSRLDQHTRQALAAVRTLTTNVSRLARLGTGMSSRRSDFVRLAGFLDRAPTAERAQAIAAAAFGLGSCRRLGTLSSDADDPDPTVTPWRSAARAAVPVALRERGDTTARGLASPMRDRSREMELLKRRRELERMARERTAAELLAGADETGRIDGAKLSRESFAMLRDLIGRSSHPGHPRYPGPACRRHRGALRGPPRLWRPHLGGIPGGPPGHAPPGGHGRAPRHPARCHPTRGATPPNPPRRARRARPHQHRRGPDDRGRPRPGDGRSGRACPRGRARSAGGRPVPRRASDGRGPSTIPRPFV